MKTIAEDSRVSLHYRISLTDDTEMISTFESEPVTFKMGHGELGRKIENRLLGLAEGSRHCFELAAGEAFGQRHQALIEHIPRSELPADTKLEVQAVLSFAAPDGSTFSGQVLEIGAENVLIDFNHPLAERALKFEVHVLDVS